MIDVNYAKLNDGLTSVFMEMTDLLSSDPESIRQKINEIEFETKCLMAICRGYDNMKNEIRDIEYMKEKYATHTINNSIFECLTESSSDDIRKIEKTVSEIRYTLKMLAEIKSAYERALRDMQMIKNINV